MDLYFQGLAWLNKGPAPDNVARARSFYDRAFSVDPDNVNPVIRLYEAISLVFPKDVHMPPGATADLPPCICCRQSSPFPPSKMGWAKKADEKVVFVVCEACVAACDDDDELERRVIAQLRDIHPGTDVVAARTETPAPAPLPAATAPSAEAAPKVGIGSPPMAAARTVPATWVRAAAKAWTQPAA